MLYEKFRLAEKTSREYKKPSKHILYALQPAKKIVTIAVFVLAIQLILLISNQDTRLDHESISEMLFISPQNFISMLIAAITLLSITSIAISYLSMKLSKSFKNELDKKKQILATKIIRYKGNTYLLASINIILFPISPVISVSLLLCLTGFIKLLQKIKLQSRDKQKFITQTFSLGCFFLNLTVFIFISSMFTYNTLEILIIFFLVRLYSNTLEPLENSLHAIPSK